MSGGEYVEETLALIGRDNMCYWIDHERPDFYKAQEQHVAMTQILRDEGVEVVTLEDLLPHMTKSVITRDYQGWRGALPHGCQLLQGREAALYAYSGKDRYANIPYDPRHGFDGGRQLPLAERTHRGGICRAAQQC